MSSSLHRAWQAIAHFLGEEVGLPQPLDTVLLGEVARVHRLEGALAEPRLTPNSPQPHVPAELFERWKTAHATGLAQAIQRETPLRAALSALAPLPVIVFKGAALAELVYPSPGARSMGDVDLLVPATALDTALTRLAQLGYQRKYPGHAILDSPAFHERQLEGPLELDLHQAFIQPERLAIDYAGLFDRALPWPALAPNAFVLSPVDCVVYTCLHAAVGELTPTWAPAIGLLDLRLLVQSRGQPRGPLWGDFGAVLDLPAVVVRAREWGAERMLYAVLSAAQRVFPSLGPNLESMQRALPLPVRAVLDALVVRRASPPCLTDPSRAEVVARKALFLNPRDRVRFALHTLASR